MAKVWNALLNTVRLLRKDLPKLLLLALGFATLFIVVVLGTTHLTNTRIMDSARSVHAIGILVAICVGGVFAYQRLQLFRTFEPHLTISHRIDHRPIGDSYTYIHVTATLHNSSKVQVELRNGYFLLQQIAPETDEQIENLYVEVYVDRKYVDLQWTTLEKSDRNWDKGELVVEPGESHPETCEFIVSRDIESVMIYSYFYDQRFSQGTGPERGWLSSTVCDIAGVL